MRIAMRGRLFTGRIEASVIRSIQRAVKHRDCATTPLCVPVDVRNGRWQQPVSVKPDLMRRPIVDAQRVGAAANIKAKRLP